MVNTRNSKREKSPPARTNNANKASDAKRSRRNISDDEEVGSDRPLILVPPREDDFNEKTWWMVDLTPIGSSSPQGASALVKRCMRTYSWDETRARKVLASYRQFIVLKKNLQDWDAEVLSPCYLVDQMWHCHILDVVNYCHDMMLLCGHVVGHNPDGAFDAVGKQKRDDTTRASLEEHFGSYDEEVWGYSPDAANGKVKNGAMNPKDTVNEERGPTAFSDDTKITLRLRDQMRKETMFKIRRTASLREIFTAYAAIKGVDYASILFMLDGERVYDETPASLDLEDGDRIDVFLQQLGC